MGPGLCGARAGRLTGLRLQELFCGIITMSLAALARSAPRLAAAVGQKSGLLGGPLVAVGLSTPFAATGAAVAGIALLKGV